MMETVSDLGTRASLAHHLTRQAFLADADGASLIAEETGAETGLRSLLRTLCLVRFRIGERPAPNRCPARGL